MFASCVQFVQTTNEFVITDCFYNNRVFHVVLFKPYTVDSMKLYLIERIQFQN